jgi:hypothetical protein
MAMIGSTSEKMYLCQVLSGTVIRGTPMLLNPVGKHLQNKP